MHFDNLMEALGEFGRYQKVRFFLLCLFSIASAWHALNMVFIGASPDFHCDVTAINLSLTPLENLSHSERKELMIPPDSECHQYDVMETLNALSQAAGQRYSEERNSTHWFMTDDVKMAIPENVSRTKVACTNGYVYSRDVYAETLTSEVSFDVDIKSLFRLHFLFIFIFGVGGQGEL